MWQLDKRNRFGPRKWVLDLTKNKTVFEVDLEQVVEAGSSSRDSVQVGRASWSLLMQD